MFYATSSIVVPPLWQVATTAWGVNVNDDVIEMLPPAVCEAQNAANLFNHIECSSVNHNFTTQKEPFLNQQTSIPGTSTTKRGK